MSDDGLQRSVLLVGVHDAGKTNYLFRFWLVLDSGQGVLSKDGLPADLEYLKTGAEYLLKGEFAPHTPQDVRDQTEIPVKTSGAGGFRGKLVVPDIPGEQVLSVFKGRQWTEHWEEQIKPGCGCLLMLRVDSDQIVAPLDWVSCAKLYGGVPVEAAPETEESGKVKPPTQIVMVEWLQFLRTAFTAKAGGNYRPRVGIVVSAWDLVVEDQKSKGPDPWIKDNFPLLHQFIDANDDNFEFTYFGVSVADGDFDKDAEFKAQYLDESPKKAGAIVHTLSGLVEKSADCTLPVAWALGVYPTGAP
jgi:hypothetical protein